MTPAKYMLFVIMILALTLAGCGGGGGWGSFSMPPTLVEVAVATVQPVEDRFETVGTIEADDAVTIVSEIGGIVVSIPFQEGGQVGRGQLIAKLDDSELKADLDRAEATLASATFSEAAASSRFCCAPAPCSTMLLMRL